MRRREKLDMADEVSDGSDGGEDNMGDEQRRVKYTFSWERDGKEREGL